jgi:DNA-binding transcriptional regulator YdaS (Cro superfamily)
MKSKKCSSPKNVALNKAVELFKFQSTLAKAIGVKQQNIWHWLNKTGVVPAEYVLKIEEATKDKGKIVTRHELRPDIYPIISPDNRPVNYKDSQNIGVN